MNRAEIVDQRAVHLLIEIEIKGVERAVGIAKARLLKPPGDQPILPTQELVTDQGGDEIDRRLLLRLRLKQADLQDIGHAREPEFAERVIEFDEIHVGSPVWRSMRSR